MSQELYRLSPPFVAKVSKKGTYGDGGGLFLQVGVQGQSKSWIFMYQRGRFGLEDTHEQFIKALKHERRAIPLDRDHTPKLLKIARAIIKEHERDYAAHEDTKKNELIQAAERYVEERRRGYVGLGSAKAISLAAVRDEARKCRELLARKIDPHDEHERLRRKNARTHIEASSFLAMGNDYICSRVDDLEHPWGPRTRKHNEGMLNGHLKPLHDWPVKV
jgi:hypothetical protein